jgi:hypothetical protein
MKSALKSLLLHSSTTGWCHRWDKLQRRRASLRPQKVATTRLNTSKQPQEFAPPSNSAKWNMRKGLSASTSLEAKKSKDQGSRLGNRTKNRKELEKISAVEVAWSSDVILQGSWITPESGQKPACSWPLTSVVSHIDTQSNYIADLRAVTIWTLCHCMWIVSNGNHWI